MTYRTDVKRDGTVLLSPVICCDGFDFKRKVRVQTHIHDDHMTNFSSSKGYQKIIFTSNPTKDFLTCDLDADIPFRYNIIACDYFKKIMLDDYIIELAPSNHMLGCVQTRVTYPDGYRVLYSSDFQMPIEHGVYECDELVIDANAYSPEQISPSIESITKILLDKVKEKYDEKNIIIQGYRGRLQYAMEVISHHFPHIPLIASDNTFKYCEIYKSYGHVINNVINSNSKKARNLFKNKRYMFFIEPMEVYKTIEENSYKIILSRFGYDKEPFLEYNPYSSRLSLSDHADFNGTINYIKETKCKRVITDSSRGGDGIELAYNIKTFLGIDAKPATLQHSQEWGV